MQESSFKAKLSAVGAFIKKYALVVWKYLKLAKMEMIVMIALFAVDLISKAIVNATVDLYESVTLIPNFLNITNVHNYDAAFGSEWLRDALGAMGARILFSVFAVAASVAFLIILIRCRGGHKLLRVSLAMLIAGAMGNCIDRMFLGYVRDFIEFVYFGYEIWGRTSFWIFNIADASLVIGVIMLVIYFIFFYRDKDSEKKSKKHGDDADKPVDANGENAENTDSSEPSIETSSPQKVSDDGNGETEKNIDSDKKDENSADDGKTEVSEQTDDVNAVDDVKPDAGDSVTPAVPEENTTQPSPAEPEEIETQPQEENADDKIENGEKDGKDEKADITEKRESDGKDTTVRSDGNSAKSRSKRAAGVKAPTPEKKPVARKTRAKGDGKA